MKKYIDCDGVILDTETGLFDKYYELKRDNPLLKKKVYLQEMDWASWLDNTSVLNDSLNLLKFYYSCDVSILTKVHSMQEAVSKIRYFRSNNIKNDIIIVPSEFEKTSVVNAMENILVDDNDNNLEDWQLNGGIPFSFGNTNSSYCRVDSLEDILDEKKLVLRLNRKSRQ